MIVLDASALVDVVLDQPSKEWVLERIAGQRVSAPAHQPAEVLSALARLERAGVLNDAQLRGALVEATALEQELVPLFAALTSRALELRERLRVLDGLYVAVAEQRGCPLVTTDERLARAEPLVEVIAPGR